ELKYTLYTTRDGIETLQLKWREELENLENHLQGVLQAAEGYHNVLEENRQLYNQVQDLKGSIRVYCRIRPFLPGQASSQTTVDFVGETGTLMIVNPAKLGKDARKTFNFNKVFGSSSTQAEIFLDTQPLIRSVLDGYNVCIFAYGQTGSGKTFTMVQEPITRMVCSVLTVHVQGTDLAAGSILRGCLHLVDLAGRGQAKTLMFVHISPEAESYGETLSTLKFAERVATVELGAARSNKESAEVRELKEQIYNLKIALAKKEAEAEQSQSSRSSRNSTERQRMKVGLSPLHSQRQSKDSQVLSNRRQPMEEVGNIESQVRSISSGRQRKPIYNRDSQGEEADSNYPRLMCRPSPERRSSSTERRSLSTDRRSLSADRGNHTKNRIKHDMLEEQEARKWQDKVMVNRHLTIHSAASRTDAVREACELAKQDSISDMFYQKYYTNPRKIYPDREDIQFLMDQNEAHVGIKRNGLELKGKQEYQLRRTPPISTDESDVDVYRTSDCSETDLYQFKELNLVDIATIQQAPRIRKTQQISTKSSYPVERRSPSQAKSPASASRLYNINGQSKVRSVRQSVASLPSGGTELKRISPGGKFTLEGRVTS
ncbi:hypothetical protein KI387_028249, partial [Taxus chinensis]